MIREMILSMLYMELRKKTKSLLYLGHLHAYKTDQVPE